jgi:hypothetical protein
MPQCPAVEGLRQLRCTLEEHHAGNHEVYSLTPERRHCATCDRLYIVSPKDFYHITSHQLPFICPTCPPQEEEPIKETAPASLDELAQQVERQAQATARKLDRDRIQAELKTKAQARIKQNTDPLPLFDRQEDLFGVAATYHPKPTGNNTA